MSNVYLLPRTGASGSNTSSFKFDFGISVKTPTISFIRATDTAYDYLDKFQFEYGSTQRI